MTTTVACTAAPSAQDASLSPPEDQGCVGVKVASGADIQSLVDANKPGSTFCFSKGIYTLTRTIDTREKQPTFDLRAGAIIDGGDGGFIGIGGPDGARLGATILGGVFQHFGNAQAPSWVGPIVVRDDGVVDGTEFRENFNAGLAIQGDRARVSNVYAHDNGRYGIVATEPCVGCPEPIGILLENSEIAYNNTRHLNPTDDAGGTKFTRTDGLTVRGNYVHDNYGAGLWFDAYNRNTQVYNNRVEGNLNWGIMYEISYGGTRIHDNLLRSNGEEGSQNWFNHVQLLVAGSDGTVGKGGIEIDHNSIDGSAYALGLIIDDGRPHTRDVFVHDNTFTLRTHATRVGAAAFDGLTALFDPDANNRFEANTYRVVDPNGSYWYWSGQTLTWNQWRSLGHDKTGSVQPLS